MDIYTRCGDDGSTGLLFGGRVSKGSERPVAYGAVDEAQAAIGLARAQCNDAELDGMLIQVSRDLYVAMSELATLDENRSKLKAIVTSEMVSELETNIDEFTGRFEPPTEFSIPGDNPSSAALDFARTVVRRAERNAVTVSHGDSNVVPYLNRLSDFLWALARWQEDAFLPAKNRGIEG